jgi:undecaprenyl-phosphate galactose phosphotransferase
MPGFDYNRNLPTVSLSGVFLGRTSKAIVIRDFARYIKVLLDIVISLTVLILVMPLFIIIAIIVSLDGGPIMYGHVRVGAAGRSFRCLKFRSMVVDSKAALERLLATDPNAAKEWAETHKLERDPRITKFGRFLRKTSLDELPQLINVIRLDMSLVGPRPIVTDEVKKYGKDIDYYYKVRPGLTGLWQISGRSKTGYSERVALDVKYVKSWTLLQDMWIIMKTIPAVLRQHGAV